MASLQIPIDAPFVPDHIEVEAEPVLADASIRQDAGIKLVIWWVRPDGTERGINQFISEDELHG
ncbi:hypothetical protein LCGC14_2143000 [marine sediment metagenome]|uniref:Uncharacterized protein n=1 Tax=marine sediment metagenome TaxID=412755 RepID=A0A0F9GAU8_9ZZZZ